MGNSRLSMLLALLAGMVSFVLYGSLEMSIVTLLVTYPLLLVFYYVTDWYNKG